MTNNERVQRHQEVTVGNGRIIVTEEGIVFSGGRIPILSDPVEELRVALDEIERLRESVFTLRNYADHSMFCEYRSLGDCDCGYAEAIKTLTVSKQEEPTADEPTCEQPEKSNLAKQVQSDLLWRQEG